MSVPIFYNQVVISNFLLSEQSISGSDVRPTIGNISASNTILSTQTIK